MKKRSLTVLALASALTVFALIPSAFAVKSASDSHAGTAVLETQSRHGRHSSGKMGEKTAEPENAIGKEAAKAAALADAGLTEEQAGKVKAHVSLLDDGTVVYKVHFSCDGQRYTYRINAATGAVVDKEKEAVAEDTESREHGKRGSGKMDEKTAEPENAIGKEAAKAAALADAGLTEEQAGKVKAHVSQLDDGTVVYKVNFTYDGQRYAYHINAVTGVVVDKENEAVTEDTESREHGKRGMGQNSVKATLTVV